MSSFGSPVAAAIAGEARASAWAFSCVFDIIETVDALALTADAASVRPSTSFFAGGWLDLKEEVCEGADSAEPTRAPAPLDMILCVSTASPSRRETFSRRYWIAC